ncbi:diaminopimelate decarboxylase [Corticibacter populi]|uniref:Diaminopimelate decarboxylase n=1 Tax=Corticibacter populi TaxID=1550736 RepID=A0A3M6QUH9_9BURK|nr:diaminopimelate decarboxylase [Corticibacter populi]RMX06680.1 diaminopimelate decarboxylase [Corticibacter populi]RZS31744.1 diaminopimelate decarboxylase [Corticibacter populi]
MPTDHAAALPGHPFFHYQDGTLFAEAVALTELAQQHGTPLFVYSQAALAHALDAYQQGFAGRNVGIHYAVKANSNLSILQFFAEQGCGFDIVSAGELLRVLQAGATPASVVFSGVGKTRAEMQLALRTGIGCFNVESEAELAVLNEEAGKLQIRAPISLRVNPDVDPQTHPYISTGLKNNKFGIPHERALQVFQQAAALPWLEVRGIDCHIGSQILSERPFLDALDKLLDLVAAVERCGIALHHIDCGGGLGIQYQTEVPPQAGALWQKMFAHADARGYGDRRFLIEPGRSLVGNAGVCLTEVLYLKPGEDKHFCIVDAAMNDLPRPAMYEAFHAISPVVPRAGTPVTTYDVVGPVCESGDWLGRDRALAVQAGDWLAVGSAGAYCMSMASNYNSRPRAAEILVHGSEHRVIRQRESFAQMIETER